MKDQDELIQWKSLFQREQQGKTPDDMSYAPIASINMPPYIPGSRENETAFGTRVSTVEHCFWVDNSAVEWFTGMADQLAGYDKITFQGNLNTDNANRLRNALQSRVDSKNFTLKIKEPLPDILDLGNPGVLSDIRSLFRQGIPPPGGVVFQPGHDFIRNIGLIRGIQKHLYPSEGENSSVLHSGIYIPFHEQENKSREGNLIPLTNQILSMMISGLHRFIWDVRSANTWQKANLIYFLNIPEILAREGNVFQEKDPIRGSGFFEELSDQIARTLQA